MTKQIIVIIGFAAAIALFSLLSLIYLGYNISANIKEIEDLRRDISFNDRIIKSLSYLKADLNSAQPFLDTLDKILSNRDQLIKFSGDANVMAAKNKINIISEFSAESKGNEGLASIGVNMTAEGSYTNFLNYLKTLENSRYSVKFNTVDFYSNVDKIKAQMTGSVFYYEE